VYLVAAGPDQQARRSLEAATIFMALVIFCVDLTLAMRVRSAFKLGMVAVPSG
jgi:hypothetical protein